MNRDYLDRNGAYTAQSMDAQMPRGAGPMLLRDYLDIVRRRKWTVIVVTLLAAALAFYLWHKAGKTYYSKSKVQVLPVVLTPSNQSGAQDPTKTLNLNTEMVVAQSTSVAQLAQAELRTRTTPDDLLNDLSVTNPQNTEVLVFEYKSKDPKFVQRAAQAFADAYLQFRRDAASRIIDTTTKRLEDQLSKSRKALNKTESDIAAAAAAAHPNKAKLAQLRSQRALLLNQINGVPQRINYLQSLNITGGTVIGPATTPVSAKSSKKLPIAIVLVGFILGLGIAFIRESTDDRLRDNLDLEERIGAPVLAAVPHLAGWRKPNETRLAMLSEPEGVVADAYRMLRAGLLHASARSGIRTVLVTSSSAGEGKTTTAANLAVAVARSNRRVCLLSADLRKPRLHKFFELPDDFGLGDVLTGHSRLEDVLIPTEIENLMLVTSGDVEGVSEDGLSSPAMERVIAELKELADFVIIDAPPLIVSDPLDLVRTVDGVLFVADAEHVSQGLVEYAANELIQGGGMIFGAVYNNFDPVASRLRSSYGSYVRRPYGYYEKPKSSTRAERKQQRAAQQEAERSEESSVPS